MDIFVKKGELRSEIKEDGKLYKLLLKTDNMEVAISELAVNASTRKYTHFGEEMHLLLKGEIEYIVGDKTYLMKEGDILSHSSDTTHWARNIGKEKAVYLTVGTPPTFM